MSVPSPSTVGIISVDSDIGRQVAEVHSRRGDRVVTTSRNSRGSVHLELTQTNTWSVLPNVDRLYYNLGVSEARISRTELMHVNAFMTIDYLKHAAHSYAQEVLFVVYSSEWGSIGLTNDPHGIHYKMSKAALNIGVKVLSVQYPRHRWLLLHPGLVQTKILSRQVKWSIQPITPEESAEATVKLADSWTGRVGFFSYTGRELPW